MNIAWLRDLNKNSIPVAGGKGAQLGEMYNSDFPVPPAFVVTAQAYKEFLSMNHLDSKIKNILNGLDVDNTKQLIQASDIIKEIIVNEEMSSTLKNEIIDAYNILNVNENVLSVSKNVLDLIKNGRGNAFVAVRSSATAEDLPEASFAGMQETFLNIKGEKNLIIAIKKCWASLFTPRAIFYRIKNNFPHEKVLIAVIVQKMINADKSGVLFTVNPGTNNKNEIVIEAGFGLGEAIVSGAVNPDLYILDKNSLKLKVKEIKKQKLKIIRDENTGETVRKNIPENEQGQQVLSESEIYKLGELGKKIDEHYGKPQDIEFAIEKSRIYIVQSRPVTTLREEVKGEQLKGEVLTSGLSASPGVKSGIVKIIRSESEIDEFPEQGHVLVTTMTNPSMVPIMRKAVAIVTDEGGVTCFSGDTNVLTNKGFICMEEAVRRVKEGEEFLIFSYDYKNKKPKWKKVINSGRRKSDVIRISVSQKGVMHHNYIDLTPDHKMFTFENRDLIKKEVKEILNEKEMLCLVDKLPEFENNDNEKLAYLTGALLSDGYIGLIKHHTGNLRRGRVVFTQKYTEEKKDFIETVKNNFKEVFKEEFSFIREKHTCGNLRGRLIQGTALDHICFKLGPALALNNISQNLDSWCLGLNESSCLNFLAGLIDSDGSFYENRLHIYVSKENVLQGIVVACLKLGIVPQVTVNRNIHHVQILERIDDILVYTKRIKGVIRDKVIGTKFFAAKQILGDIIDNTNYLGRIKPYVDNNLLLDERKIKNNIIPMLDGKIKNEVLEILNSNIRMHRVSKEDEFGETYVYNLEVEADNEMSHNYVVFTKKYTPLLVSNSHAAIVSRELGIPCIVGSENATSVLEDGLIITVDANNGKVYKGEVKKEEQKSIEILDKGEGIETKTKIYMNLGEPEKISYYKDLNFDGIGLMRLEFIIAGEVGEHPNFLIKNNEEEKYINELVKGIEKIARAINGKPIIVRFSDFKTNEYKDLKGGKEFEEHEDNPMIGFRGVSRYISDEFKESFKLECRAIKKVRETYRNVHVMLPFVRTVEEVEKCLEIMKEEKLERSDDFKIWLMAEVPSMALISEDFAKLPIDGVSIGSNDLTMLCLGVDRDNEKLGRMGYFDERNKAVLVAIKNIIDGFKKYGKTTSLCGQSVSNYPEIAEFLVRNGITSVSVNPDVIGKVRRFVAELEKKIELERASSL